MLRTLIRTSYWFLAGLFCKYLDADLKEMPLYQRLNEKRKYEGFLSSIKCQLWVDHGHILC